MDQVGERHPGQLFRRVAVLGDRRAGIPDPAVEIADQHDIGDALGKLAELAARFPPGDSHRPVPDQQARGPDGQREHRDRPGERDRRLGGRPAGQRPRENHQGRGRRRERGGQRGPAARLPGLAMAFEQAHARHRPVRGKPHPARVDQRRRAQQAERGDLRELRPRPGNHRVDLGADGKRVTHRHRERSSERRQPSPARDRHVRQDHAEDDQVSQRVEQGQGERARAVAGPSVDRSEQRHPADDEKRGSQHVAIGEPHGGIAWPDGGRIGARGCHGHQAGHHRGQGEEREKITECQRHGSPAERPGQGLLGDEARAQRHGSHCQPAIGTPNGTLVTGRAPPENRCRRDSHDGTGRGFCLHGRAHRALPAGAEPTEPPSWLRPTANKRARLARVPAGFASCRVVAAPRDVSVSARGLLGQTISYDRNVRSGIVGILDAVAQ